nr:UDP-glucuronosyltransferase 3A1-like [Halyomorpha halys]
MFESYFYQEYLSALIHKFDAIGIEVISLAHKNCVLFITHGGLLSLSESIYYSVPQLGIPIMADQEKNMVIMESHGLGRMLKLNNITRETISWTINEVLSNSRYREEALRRSKILKRQKAHASRRSGLLGRTLPQVPIRTDS